MKIDKIHKDDIEGIRYPDLDTKRKIWDFALADKLNEALDKIAELQEQIDEQEEYIDFLLSKDALLQNAFKTTEGWQDWLKKMKKDIAEQDQEKLKHREYYYCPKCEATVSKSHWKEYHKHIETEV